MEYSLSDLVEITGAKRRALQLWAEAGVILTEDAIHSGRGTHRRYSRQEAAIACLMVPFARLQMSIGALANVSASIRGILDGQGSGKVRWADIEASIAGSRKSYLIVNTWEGNTAVTLFVPRPSATANTVSATIGSYVAEYESQPASITLALLVNTHVQSLR